MKRLIHWGTVDAAALGRIFVDMPARRIRQITIGNFTLCWYAPDRISRDSQ